MSALDSHTVVIDGTTYVLTHAPTSVGLRAGARLTNMVAPILRTGEGTIEAALSYILGAPDLGGNLEFLCRCFTPTTVVHTAEGKTFALDKIFETHFAGDHGALIGWLTAALKYDLSSFLAGLSRAVAEAKAKAAELAKANAPAESSPLPPTVATTG